MSALLQASDLHIGFGGVQAAAGVHLDVQNGEHLAIIGPNGAGKTTFINICTGYLKPQRGRVLFEGRDITARPPRAITRLGIARAFQIPQLFSEHSVRDNLLLALAARQGIWQGWRPLQRIENRHEADQLLTLFQLDNVAEQAIRELPEGLRKLIDIAMALALRPRLLLMDEPTSGVASSEKFAVMDTLMNALRTREVTSVFVEHDMEVVTRYADRVAVWNSGVIQAEGPPAQILNDTDVLRDVIGV
ncbi:MAG: ATP-binding cassette domain-containing protein [Gammaproteobacteria bacterium]